MAFSFNPVWERRAGISQARSRCRGLEARKRVWTDGRALQVSFDSGNWKIALSFQRPLELLVLQIFRLFYSYEMLNLNEPL